MKVKFWYLGAGISKEIIGIIGIGNFGVGRTVSKGMNLTGNLRNTYGNAGIGDFEGCDLRYL